MDKITAYYNTRLGVDLGNLNHPISKLIHQANNTTGIQKKQIQQKLRMLGLALMDIKAYDKNIYDFYLKKTINNADFSLNGFIFEIIQCSNLIRIAAEKSMQFKFGDHNKNEPDFIIDGCGLELTSIRFPEESQKNNADSKLLNKFQDKNMKKYANPNSLLLIEITQPVHFANQGVHNPYARFDNLLKIISEESHFGIVLCYVEYTVVADDNLLFRGTVYPAYGKTCTENVKDLFKKITNGEFNTFDGTQRISKY